MITNSTHQEAVSDALYGEGNIKLNQTIVRIEHQDNKHVYQAYLLLQLSYVAIPIIAGVDKYLDVLSNWSQYLTPVVADWFGAAHFMFLVGAIEILAGIGVALKPRVFSYVVAIWLFAIVVNLLLTGYLEIALRDFGLAVGALALGRLSGKFR